MQDFNKPIDRRHKMDKIIKLVTITSVLGWVMIIITTMIAIYAKPEHTNMFYEMFNVPIRNYWNYHLLSLVFILLIGILLLSIFGITMNAMRLRRKTDRINKSLIFHALMSLLGIILLLAYSVIG